MKSIMELIRTLREKHITSQQQGINDQAHKVICLDDFDNKVYISYNGAPLIPIEDTWTQKDIIKKLNETRNSYINYLTHKLKRGENLRSALF